MPFEEGRRECDGSPPTLPPWLGALWRPANLVEGEGVVAAGGEHNALQE